jgi:hypothetical protein
MSAWALDVLAVVLPQVPSGNVVPPETPPFPEEPPLLPLIENVPEPVAPVPAFGPPTVSGDEPHPTSEATAQQPAIDQTKTLSCDMGALQR